MKCDRVAAVKIQMYKIMKKLGPVYGELGNSECQRNCRKEIIWV